jgi:hypothetical protein
MDDSIGWDTMDDDLYAIPDLRLDLLLRPQITDFRPYTADKVIQRLRVPGRFADFFIECFALDEPEETLHRTPKQFPPEGSVLKFQIPVVVPFFVSSEGRQMTFGFVDTPVLRASEAEQIVKWLLNKLWSRRLFVVKMESIDARSIGFNEIDDLAMNWDVRVLAEFGPMNAELETQDFTLFIIKSHWDEEVDAAVRRELERLYEHTALNYCSRCGLLFSAGDGDACFTTRHRGTQIPFEGGLDEVVEWEEGDDEAIIFVRYTCCQEVPKDDPGCERVPAGAHILDPARPFSRVTYSESGIPEVSGL